MWYVAIETESCIDWKELFEQVASALSIDANDLVMYSYVSYAMAILDLQLTRICQVSQLPQAYERSHRVRQGRL